MSSPDWWEKAEVGIHEAVADFSERVRKKTNEPPSKILVAKNPFLFRARVTTDAELLARMMVDAFLSSSEETMFGDVLEKIALAICSPAKGGRKSSTESIDLEYDVGKQRTIIQVKSGPKWSNSRSRRALERSFSTAKRVIRQGKTDIEVRCIEGICYGPSETRDMGDYWKLIGNDFWYDISGWDGTARGVFHIVGQHAGNGLEEARRNAYNNLVSYMRKSGAITPTGQVEWNTLLEMVMTKGGRPSASKQSGLLLQ